MSALLKLVLLFCGLFQLGAANLQLYAVAVGQGDSNIILCPNQQDIVIVDIGATRPIYISPDYVTNLLRTRFNAAQSGKRIHIIATHGHTDHYGYIHRAIDNKLLANVQQVILGDSYAKYGKSFKNWLNSNLAGRVYSINNEQKCFGNVQCQLTPVSGLKSSRYHGNRNDPWQLCGSDVRFNVLGANIGSNPNSRSLVLRLVYQSWSVFMAGDFEEVAAQRELLQHWGASDLQSTYYKVAHHGAWTDKQANHPDLLAKVSPQKAYMSQGYPDFSTYHHPNCDTIAHLMALKTIRPLSNANMNSPFVCWNSTVAKTTIYPGLPFEIYETCRKTTSDKTSQVCQDISIVSNGVSDITTYIDVPVKYLRRPRQRKRKFP